MAADLKAPEYWETSILRGTGRLFMLAALADQPRHGYDIARRISQLCGDWCSPSDAMIYPAIRDLEAAGLIQCKVAEGARKRRVCSLTPEGRVALRVGADAWARYLPALGRVVAAAQQGAEVGSIPIDADCCPTCCSTDTNTAVVATADIVPEGQVAGRSQA